MTADRPEATDADETTDATDRDPVEALADEFIARRRRGERPAVEEYAARCPERSGEIRELFPAIAAMELLKPRPSSARPRPVDPPRERLGEYRLIREIGRGGMGIVYEAEQESLGRRVAIKVLPGQSWHDGRPMERFLRESRTAAGLSHGNIVAVHHAGSEDGLAYYVMPLIEGVGLDRLVAELRRRLEPGHEAGGDDLAATVADRLLVGEATAGPAPAISPAAPRVALGAHYWSGVARAGVDVAEALRHAHENGVLHRDIKPANLLMLASGRVLVTDFGLAKATGHDDLSLTGDLVGTLGYMAPERLRNVADARSDVFSLGLTLYELAALRRAYESADRLELIRRVAEGRPPRLRDRAPGLPAALEAVILKAIDPDPDRRYATAGAMAGDLSWFLAGHPVHARPAAPPERLARWARRNRAVAALAVTTLALALVAAYFIALFLLAPPRPAPPPGPPGPGPPPPRRWSQPGPGDRPPPPPPRRD